MRFWSLNTVCPADYKMFNKVKSYSKIDGLDALSMVQVSRSADEIVIATNPCYKPEMKLAVKYRWFPAAASTRKIGRSWEKTRNAVDFRHY